MDAIENGQEPVPPLRLYVDTRQLVDARQAGKMIERLAHAYGQYSRRAHGIPGRLAVEDIGTSSLFVILRDLVDLAGATLTMYEHREILGGFVSHLSDALTAFRQLSAAQLPAATRTAVQALAGPVITGGANSVCVNVQGDNNHIFIVDRTDEELIRAITKQPRANDSAVADVETLHDDVAQRMEGPLPRRLYGQNYLDRAIEHFGELPRAPIHRDTQMFGTNPNFVAGLLLSAGGQWYVQPDGLGGALLPTEVPDDLDLAPGDTKLVEGRVIRSKDNPTGFVIRGVYTE